MEILSIVIVNFKSEKYIWECLESIKNQKLKTEIQIIIVNADNSNYTVGLSRFSKSSLVINLKKNLGYGYSVNQGVKNAVGDYLLILNPDVIIKEGLDIALKFISKNNSIVGANLFTEEGNQQRYAFGNFHSLFVIFLNKIGYRNLFVDVSQYKVDWVAGTAMLMRKSLFLKLGGFDTAYFMYFEDQDLCYRAKKLWAYSFVLKDFKVIHFGGKSFNSKPSRLNEYNKSLKLFLSKHGSLFDKLIINIWKPIYDVIKNK